MARPKSEMPAPTEHAPTPETQLTVMEDLAAQKQLAAHQNLGFVITQMTNLPNDLRLLKIELAKTTEITNVSKLYAGAILLKMQHQCTKDAYIEAITEYGYTFGYAQRLQAMYVRFGELEGFRELGPAKLKALLPLEDELIEQIQAGEIPNLKPSDMLRLTTKELIKEVLELREEKRANTERLKEARNEKDAALDKLQARDRALEDKQARAGVLFGMLETASMQLITALKVFSDTRMNFVAHLSDTKTIMSDAQEEAMAKNTQWIRRWLDQAEISVYSLDQAENGGIPL